MDPFVLNLGYDGEPLFKDAQAVDYEQRIWCMETNTVAAMPGQNHQGTRRKK